MSYVPAIGAVLPGFTDIYCKSRIDCPEDHFCNSAWDECVEMGTRSYECETDDDCSWMSGFCNPSGWCCEPGSKSKWDEEQQKFVCWFQQCDIDDDCGDHASCLSGVCRCHIGYRLVHGSDPMSCEKFPPGYGHCLFDLDCEHYGPGYVCGANNRCVQGKYLWNILELGRKCSSNNDCASYFCSSGHCTEPVEPPPLPPPGPPVYPLEVKEPSIAALAGIALFTAAISWFVTSLVQKDIREGV